MENQETMAATLIPDTTAEPGDAKRKDDGSELGSTQRSATLRFRNNWGTALASATIRHRIANSPTMSEQLTWYNLLPKGESPANQTLALTYWTGPGSDYDYWWASIELNNGDVYTSKANFYCNLTADDQNQVVWAVVDGQSNSLRIEMPRSSSCATDSMTKR